MINNRQTTSGQQNVPSTTGHSRLVQTSCIGLNVHVYWQEAVICLWADTTARMQRAMHDIINIQHTCHDMETPSSHHRSGWTWHFHNRIQEERVTLGLFSMCLLEHKHVSEITMLRAACQCLSTDSHGGSAKHRERLAAARGQVRRFVIAHDSFVTHRQTPAGQDQRCEGHCALISSSCENAWATRSAPCRATSSLHTPRDQARS